MNAILSIKPIYARSILSGKKKVEFRKASFKRDVRKIYIFDPKALFTNFTPPQSFCYCADIKE